MSTKTAPDAYTVRKIGHPHTPGFRVYVEKDGSPVSIFHDILLFAGAEQSIFNMVVEIPRWTNEKFEISRTEPLKPIKQGEKDGKPKFVRNRFPHKGYIWNYGALPREDPNAIHPETQAQGDNDPIDACEIGERVAFTGQVKQVKVLGVLAMLDEGATDWKLIVIDIRDLLAEQLNDIGDVEIHMPGLLKESREWFRLYKLLDGKPPNEFAFNGQFKDKRFALEILQECSEAWERLITGKTPPGEISLANVTYVQSPHQVNPKLLNIPEAEDLPPASVDGSMDRWFFVF